MSVQLFECFTDPYIAVLRAETPDGDRIEICLLPEDCHSLRHMLANALDRRCEPSQ